MDFGVVVSCHWSPKQILDASLKAEALGLDFLLLTDHYMTPTTDTSVDAWIMLAAVAAKTERIKLGTCVTPIPFRPPQILAKIVATVDQISEGRVALGVGAGWHRPEFEAYSAWDSDGVRVAKTKEGIRLMRGLWMSKGPVNFHGRFYRVKNAILEPKPVQKPHPPIWFGTTGTRMLRFAAKHAEAWVPPVPGVDIGTYKKVILTLKEYRPKEAAEVKVNFNGTIQELKKSIEEFMEIDCDGAILARTSYKDLPSAMKRLSTEIIPSYKRRR